MQVAFFPTSRLEFSHVEIKHGKWTYRSFTSSRVNVAFVFDFTHFHMGTNILTCENGPSSCDITFFSQVIGFFPHMNEHFLYQL